MVDYCSEAWESGQRRRNIIGGSKGWWEERVCRRYRRGRQGRTEGVEKEVRGEKLNQKKG